MIDDICALGFKKYIAFVLLGTYLHRKASKSEKNKVYSLNGKMGQSVYPSVVPPHSIMPILSCSCFDVVSMYDQ